MSVIPFQGSSARLLLKPLPEYVVGAVTDGGHKDPTGQEPSGLDPSWRQSSLDQREPYRYAEVVQLFREQKDFADRWCWANVGWSVETG